METAGADQAERNPALIVRRSDPLNCEVQTSRLVGGVVVTNEDFFIRNHFPVPTIDMASWRLRVHGLVNDPLGLTLHELMNMPAHSMVLTLECAGNGRSFFTPPIEGERWGLGAVSTAEWTGTLLSDVMGLARIESPAQELVFRGADTFERSLQIEDAGARPVLLAYAMNGEPLPANHGFPLRAIVPGWYSVTDVKWLSEIEVIGNVFNGYYQTQRYVFEWERNGVASNEPVRHQRVRSLITHPADGDEVRTGELAIRGLVWSGSAAIAKVEVAVGGKTWVEASLLGEAIPYCWQRWELITRVERAGRLAIRSRATDAEGNTQPEEAEWNRLGYGNNSIQEVEVRAR